MNSPISMVKRLLSQANQIQDIVHHLVEGQVEAQKFLIWIKGWGANNISQIWIQSIVKCKIKSEYFEEAHFPVVHLCVIHLKILNLSNEKSI